MHFPQVYLQFHLVSLLFTTALTNTNHTKPKGKEKVSVLLQSAISFYNAAKNIEDKLHRLQNYQPYEKGMKIMTEFHERISRIYSSMEELKERAETVPNIYTVEIDALLAKIDSENDDLIDIMKLLLDPKKYYDENEIVQKIKDEKSSLTDDLRSFDKTAREFMKNVDPLEESKIYLYTLEESNIKFDFSIMERLLEMYEHVEEYEEQLAPFGENIPKNLNRIRNSLNILTQIEIPTFLVSNGNMFENFVPSIIRAVENTQEKYSNIDNMFDRMLTAFLEEVNSNKIQLEKFLKLTDELKILSESRKDLGKDEL